MKLGRAPTTCKKCIRPQIIRYFLNDRGVKREAREKGNHDADLSTKSKSLHIASGHGFSPPHSGVLVEIILVLVLLLS